MVMTDSFREVGLIFIHTTPCLTRGLFTSFNRIRSRQKFLENAVGSLADESQGNVTD